MSARPLCDWCSRCDCCPAHACEGCAGDMSPVEWLEQHYHRLDDLYEFPAGSSGLVRKIVVGFNGESAGMLFSLKDDDRRYEDLYCRYVPPDPDLQIDPSEVSHP